MTTEDEILKVAREACAKAEERIGMPGEPFRSGRRDGAVAMVWALLGARALAAHLAAGAEPVARWRSLDEAPKDGALVRLLVQHDGESFTSFEDSPEPYTTIGFNSLADTGEDRWQFAGWDWSHDCFTDGHGEVLNWAPFLTPPPAPAVKVKALIWTDHPAGGRQAVAAGLGLYRVHRNGKSWYLDQDHMGDVGGELSAQAHYEQCIRSALAEDAGAVIQNLTEMGDQSCLISTPIMCSSKLQNSDEYVSVGAPSSTHSCAPDLADLRYGAASPLADVASQEGDTQDRPLSLSAASLSSNEPLNSGNSFNRIKPGSTPAPALNLHDCYLREQAAKPATPAPVSDDLVNRLDAPTPFYGWKDPENYTPVMIPPGPLRTEASARIRSDATTIASLRAEVEKLRRVDQSCRWYWPEGATESENCSDCPQEVVQNVSGWGEPTGEVIAVARGGVVEVSYCAALPPASDADSDDEFWVQEPSIELAAAKIAAELERRAALAPIPAKEG